MLNFVDSIRPERTAKQRKMRMSIQGEWDQDKNNKKTEFTDTMNRVVLLRINSDSYAKLSQLAMTRKCRTHGS